MVLLKGVQIGTPYKMIEITISDRCKNSIVLRLGLKNGKLLQSMVKDYVVTSKTREYQREGALNTTR
jgi:hypothetical protein